MIVLGIESSCDETSVAIINDEKILTNTIYTQKEHSDFGGVVPEIASREHIKKIGLLFKKAINETNLKISDIDLIAVCDRPGLAGALLVGISFAFGLKTAYPQIAITGVNHLEGHICSVMFENKIKFPFLTVLLSGGHSSIYKVDDFSKYEIIGQTIDDAAGEAFDKVGKMLGFEYPAGKKIEEYADLYKGNDLIEFPTAKIFDGNNAHFSFSGLKTSVKYAIEKIKLQELEEQKPRICKSFQNAIVRAVVNNLKFAVNLTHIEKIALCGGVACNNAIKNALKDSFGTHNVFYPSNILCTDNAAMIAKAGMENYKRGIFRTPSMTSTAEIGRKVR
ncbi:MAG: tRNA (adenosine(37)-N6)-threonylcarbamoyltransferase complex transferase subunit TsaD [Chitinispirillales bacterium]|jgi:N6-L-threonylcarbamoyladenine synthase|nr:tRNA (adenosine(37)-N6)-threonylcarbamoyltransferase complex transferase subunit TsaD [Chitinispirillales bacterium]